MEDLIKGLHVGNIFCLMHVGNMPADKCMYSTKLFADKVMPQAAQHVPRMCRRQPLLVQADEPSGSPPAAWRRRRRASVRARRVSRFRPRRARSWNLKTVETRHAPSATSRAASGEPLVYLHGAGGMTPDDPLLKELASRFHVYAPCCPGYGETEECGELRDMLDFALHGWDVVEALGLKNPILVGHSWAG